MLAFGRAQRLGYESGRGAAGEAGLRRARPYFGRRLTRPGLPAAPRRRRLAVAVMPQPRAAGRQRRHLTRPTLASIKIGVSAEKAWLVVCCRCCYRAVSFPSRGPGVQAESGALQRASRKANHFFSRANSKGARAGSSASPVPMPSRGG